MSFAPSLPAWFAFAAGAATVFGFAPLGAALLPLVTLALLFVLWQDAPTSRAAARTGFAFGVGLFGAGVSWVYIAIHTFGGMPAGLAAIGTAGFVAYLALFPAAAGFLAARWTAPRTWQRALASAGAWTALEWLRSLALLRIRLAFAGLQPGARQPACRLCAHRRRVRGNARPRACRGGDCTRHRCVRSGCLASRRRPYRSDGRARRDRSRAWKGRLDGPRRRADWRIARAGQRAAGPQVRSGFPHADLRSLHGARCRRARAAG